jgi:hypothetical protein
MRLRCPEKNCPVDVPDDMFGMTIRCPHCGSSFVANEKNRENVADVPQLSIDSSSKQPGKKPVQLEHQIYDGLPPLAVMMAMRRQQAGFDLDDIAVQKAMTADDWKALAAFEQILIAIYSLRTTLVVGGLSFAVNFAVCWNSATPHGLDTTAIYLRSAIQFLLLILLGVCLPTVYFGMDSLRSIRRNAWAMVLPWMACGVAILASANIVVGASGLAQEANPSWLTLLTLVSLPLNAITAFDSCKSGWRAWQSLGPIAAPGIAQLLIDALR